MFDQGTRFLKLLVAAAERKYLSKEEWKLTASKVDKTKFLLFKTFPPSFSLYSGTQPEKSQDFPVTLRATRKFAGTGRSFEPLSLKDDDVEVVTKVISSKDMANSRLAQITFSMMRQRSRQRKVLSCYFRRLVLYTVSQVYLNKAYLAWPTLCDVWALFNTNRLLYQR